MTKFPWDKTYHNKFLTVIPTHVIILESVKTIPRGFHDFRDKVVLETKEKSDKR